MMFNNKKSRNLSIVQPVEFVKIILTVRVTSTSRLSAPQPTPYAQATMPCVVFVAT